MTTNLVSPVFVGRREQRDRLVSLLERAASGEPEIAFVGGEAGVGKSRLVQEIVTAAGQRGIRVLFGNCVQLGAEGLAFAPLVDALRVLARSMPPADFNEVLGAARRPLLRFLPNLGAATTESTDNPNTDPDPGVTGAQLLELVLGLLERLSLRSPVLLVIEDLHWADQSTLDLVAYLVRALRGVPIALIGTYRSDEMPRRHPLRSLLTSWERSRAVHRIELGRFDRAEVAAQLSAILGRPPDRGLLDTIVDRSEGNAFLVEELLGVATAGGNPNDLPQSLRDVLLTRVDAMSPQAQRLLRTAAVGGRWVSERLLLEVSGLDEPTAFGALREVVENHLLVVDGEGRGYAFRHALARDAVYEDMLPGERVRLHSAYGEVLSESPLLAGDDPGELAANLAHHWYAALDLPRALPASVNAAGYASKRYASAEALRHLERALQIWPRVADAETRCGIDQVEILRQAAEAAFVGGAIDRSLDLLDHALTELGPDGDPARRASLLERKSYALSTLHGSEAALGPLTEALNVLPAEETTVVHARVLTALAHARMRINDLDGSIAMGERARKAVQASGADLQNELDILLGYVRACLGGHELGVTAGLAGVRRARQQGQAHSALRGYINLADALELMGRSAEAAEFATEGLAYAQEVGYASSLGTYLTGNLVESLVRLGRWDEAEKHIDRALADDPEGIFAASVLEVRGLAAALAGNYAKARDSVDRARRLIGTQSEPQFENAFAFTRAEIARAGGDPDGALGLLREALRSVSTDPASARYNWPLVWLGTRIEADRLADGGAPPPPDPIIDTAVRSLADTVPPAAGYHRMAEAERARRLGEPALEDWRQAAGIWRELERPYELAYSLIRLAEAQAATGSRDEARDSARQAHRTASAIAAVPLVELAEQVARRARLDLGGAGEPVAHKLTQRELEVLRMLAAGQSNPEIARQLYISPKTASVHVSNILAKLGVSGRVEAATLAQRLGMLAD